MRRIKRIEKPARLTPFFPIVQSQQKKAGQAVNLHPHNQRQEKVGKNNHLPETVPQKIHHYNHQNSHSSVICMEKLCQSAGGKNEKPCLPALFRAAPESLHAEKAQQQRKKYILHLRRKCTPGKRQIKGYFRYRCKSCQTQGISSRITRMYRALHKEKTEYGKCGSSDATKNQIYPVPELSVQRALRRKRKAIASCYKLLYERSSNMVCQHNDNGCPL